MNVIELSDVNIEESKNPLFTGGRVDQQFWVDDKIAKDLRVNRVAFRPGARTKVHTHTTEQVLYVTEGKGIVATDKDEYVITPGMVVFIPAGESHWHGATEDTSLAHVSIKTDGPTSF